MVDNKYKVVSTLGNNTKRKFGEVYLGKSTFNNELFVIKKIKKSAPSNHINHFLNEANFSFEDESLPKVYDLIENENEWVLIKKFQEGIPLDEFKQSIPLKKRKSFVLALLKALRSSINILKNQNVTHCDLKPSNIIINKTNNDFKVSIIDFAYAKKTENTYSKKLIFSLGYSAPELILNQQNHIDHNTDLYSLGCIVYNLLCDKVPFHHPNPTIMTSIQLNHPLFISNKIDSRTLEILNKICHKGKFPVKTSLNYSSIIETELSKSKIIRYQSIDEIILDLETVFKEKTKWWKLF
jgi:serine/threonine protein kinase